jgi:hypothetical protein
LAATITRNARLTRAICQYAAIISASVIVVFNPVVVQLIGLSGYRRYSFLIDIYGATVILTCFLFRYREKLLRYLCISLITLSPVYAFATEIWIVQRQVLAPRPSTHLENTHQRDPLLGWAPIPNAVGRHAVPGNFDVEYRFDERDRKKIDQDPSVKKTIHVFGDSYIFGHGVSNDDTALNLLAKDLKGVVNIQNYGVMGYGLEQMYVRLERNASEIAAGDIVLFVPTASSLARNVIDKEYACEHFFAGHMRRSLQIDEMGRTWINLEDRCNYLFDVLLRRTHLPFSLLYQWYRSWKTKGKLTENADRILKMAKAVADQRRAEFILLFIARPSECKMGYHDTDWRDLEMPFDTLLTYCPKETARAEGFSFPTEGHLNPAGHVWLANALRQYLAKRGIARSEQDPRGTR